MSPAIAFYNEFKGGDRKVAVVAVAELQGLGTVAVGERDDMNCVGGRLP